MTFDRGKEVYVFLEGVFTLEESVDAGTSSWVTVRTASGARIDLPIEAVAEWDVDSPIGPSTSRLAAEPTPFNGPTRRQASVAPVRRLRRV